MVRKRNTGKGDDRRDSGGIPRHTQYQDQLRKASRDTTRDLIETTQATIDRIREGWRKPRQGVAMARVDVVEKTPRVIPMDPIKVPITLEPERKVGYVTRGLLLEPVKPSDARKRDEDTPKCKERPEPGPRRSGGGASRRWVPWCNRKR